MTEQLHKPPKKTVNIRKVDHNAYVNWESVKKQLDMPSSKALFNWLFNDLSLVDTIIDHAKKKQHHSKQAEGKK